MRAVLDFANGYQKEKQEEVDEIKENRRKEDESGKEAGSEADSYQEIGEEGGCSKQSQTEKAEPEANSRSENCESG
jgi:hypothetical protein